MPTTATRLGTPLGSFISYSAPYNNNNNKYLFISCFVVVRMRCPPTTVCNPVTRHDPSLTLLPGRPGPRNRRTPPGRPVHSLLLFLFCFNFLRACDPRSSQVVNRNSCVRFHCWPWLIVDYLVGLGRLHHHHHHHRHRRRHHHHRLVQNVFKVLQVSI